VKEEWVLPRKCGTICPRRILEELVKAGLKRQEEEKRR